MADANEHTSDLQTAAQVSPTRESFEDDEAHVQNEQGSETDVEKRREQPEKPSILSRISSRRSASSWKDPGPPPDGGIEAWTQVVMVHLVIFVTWGYVNSFGVFQTYYVNALNHPFSDIAWIGSVQMFLMFFIGTFSGRALDFGLFRVVFSLGLVLQLLGIFMVSLSTQYWQIFLAQGICTGIGDGLMFCPSMALLSTYFSKNKVLALAIAACGSGTGGLVFPAMVKTLLPSIGFPWTVRALGFLQLGLNALAFAFLRTRVPPRKSGSFVDASAFKEPTYLLFVTGIFFCFWSLYFAFFYVGTYAANILHVSYSDSINLLFVLNGIGIIARIVPAIIADRYTGPLNIVTPLALFSGVLMFAWSGVANEGGLYAFTVVFGMFSNGIQSLWPAVLSTLTTDLKKAGTRMGMGFSVVSFACLTGPPLAGALIQQDNGTYLYAQMWAGSSLTLGALILVCARYASAGWKLKVRV